MNAFILVLGCFRRGKKDLYTIVKFELNNNNKKETNMWIEQMSNLTWQQLLVGPWIFLFLWFFLPRLTKITSTNHKPRDNQKGDWKQINPVHWYETKSQLCESEHDLRSRNEQPKRLKKNLKKISAWPGINPWPLCMPTGLNFLSINLNKPTGEQAIVSS